MARKRGGKQIWSKKPAPKQKQMYWAVEQP